MLLVVSAGKEGALTGGAKFMEVSRWLSLLHASFSARLASF